MIVTLLETRGSCVSALDYSEKKVAECTATVCSVHNIPSYTPKDIYRTILSYESNPRISARTRDLKFHMAVSPGEDDRIDRVSCLQFIDELMRDIGYGEQPYVVYRHNDIEREHYHVVSVKVDADGKSLWKAYDADMVLDACRSLEGKYGFHLGASRLPHLTCEEMDVSRSFDARAGHIYDQFRTHFAEACMHDVRSEEDFAAVLESRGISYRTHATGDGRVNVILQGMGDDGALCTRPCFMGGRMRVDGYAMMLEAVSRGLSHEESRRSDRVDAICSRAMDVTPTAAHFRRYMEELGLYVKLRRDGDGLGRITDMLIVDRENGRVLHMDDLSVLVQERILAMEQGAAPGWKRSSRREAQLLRSRTLVNDAERRRVERILSSVAEKQDVTPEQEETTVTRHKLRR